MSLYENALLRCFRIFDAQRGMDYIVDVVFSNSASGENVEKRVFLTRPIQSSSLMHNVPYVKEDSDLTIVVGVSLESEVSLPLSSPSHIPYSSEGSPNSSFASSPGPSMSLDC